MTDTAIAPPVALLLFDELLQALGDADGGDALYRMHDPQAILRHGDAIRPAAQIDAAEFARSHRALCLSGARTLPVWQRQALLHVDSVADEVVAWFDVRELASQRELIVALGLIRVQGSWRVGWCTTAAHRQDWSYRHGLLQSLADYPWMRQSEPAACRALLDASYFRRHWRAPLRFSTLPDARFSCQMSAACCKHDFEISLPSEAQLLIDAIPWQAVRPQLLGTQLPRRADGQLQLKHVNETCRFLGPLSQCLIHQTLGQQPFGTCAVFPFAFAQTPEGIAVALSPVCGSVRLGLGLAPLQREDDLREKLIHARPKHTDHYRLTAAIELTWEDFSKLESALCQCLASDECPMRRRLMVASRLLGAVSRGEPIDTARWLTEPMPDVSDELRHAIRDLLAKILGWDRAALRDLPREIPAPLSALEVGDTAIVVRIFQNVVYSKVYSYAFDLTTAHNLLIVLYLLTLIMQASCSGPLPERLWQELGSLGVHGLLKNVLHEGVPQGFRDLVGTAEFGQWALAV